MLTPSVAVFYRPLDHCKALQKEWHLIRKDIETNLGKRIGDDEAEILAGQKGQFEPDMFQGHCLRSDWYLPIGISKAKEMKIPEFLWETP